MMGNDNDERDRLLSFETEQTIVRGSDLFTHLERYETLLQYSCTILMRKSVSLNTWNPQNNPQALVYSRLI